MTKKSEKYEITDSTWKYQLIQKTENGSVVNYQTMITRNKDNTVDISVLDEINPESHDDLFGYSNNSVHLTKGATQLLYVALESFLKE